MLSRRSLFNNRILVANLCNLKDLSRVGLVHGATRNDNLRWAPFGMTYAASGGGLVRPWRSKYLARK